MSTTILHLLAGSGSFLATFGLSPRLLGTFSVNGHVAIALAALICPIALAGVVVVTALLVQNKKRQMWHETARLALEKGHPIPPMPRSDEGLELTPPPGSSLAEWETIRRARDRRSSLKGGLVLIAVGVGLYIMLWHDADRLVGAIPALIGVALIVHILIDKLSLGHRAP